MAGIVCAVAWSVSLRGLLARPGIDASRVEIARFYVAHDDGGHVGLLLALGNAALAGAGGVALGFAAGVLQRVAALQPQG